ncbi:BglG family transcription antiterminator [Enterovibrio sp. ZSDZ35]|uniref:BglG family transcription antiterminator n=1 Tax=Enterovibrio qingdaonensis TaxID=2899818 RepID=A0ABT5QM00_9GAMM|nr:PRD domain-containing protein [Enterovibrio sp. ZSDZ35]MDD1781530.1 BglG family transcription antiterminator [Enterovibrio sp. ZSDZ35]
MPNLSQPTLPHPRLIRLLDAVSNSPLTQEELAQRLNVSTRTVRTDVATLNNVMVNHGAHLIHQRGSGYQLKIYNQEAFETFQLAARDADPAPRTSKERIVQIQVLLLTADDWVKLDDLADTWNLSRAAVQGDMADVRAQLSPFGIKIDSKPRLGMRIKGCETAIRARLSQIIYSENKESQRARGLIGTLFPSNSQQVFAARFREILVANKLYINDDGLHWLAIYAAVALQRLASGQALEAFPKEDVVNEVLPVAQIVFDALPTLIPANEHEIAALAINIQARISASQHAQTILGQIEAEKLVNHILDYVHRHYPYDIRQDMQLRRDLQTHISKMIVRVKHHVATVNPLAEHIKQHYPLAYDITLAAIADWIRETGYCMTQHEIGYLVIHVGVGLERNHYLGHRAPKAMLYCDAGNAISRGLEAIIRRHYPQLELETVYSAEYLRMAQQPQVDMIITTNMPEGVSVPVFVLDPFPTQHQLEELGKLVLVDRTGPYMLEKYFSAEQFLYIEESIDQASLFDMVCEQLETEGLVEVGFGDSLKEREVIVSTMMGEHIALPHSIELFAKHSLVYTVAAPKGIDWGNGEKAYLVFFMALSKNDYEEAMGLYDLFLTLVNNKAGKTLSQCSEFQCFKTLAHQELV